MDFCYTMTFLQCAYTVCTMRKWKQYIENPAERVRLEKIPRVHIILTYGKKVYRTSLDLSTQIIRILF